MTDAPLPTLRALSFHRPYGELILAGVKPVENRGWPPPKALIAGFGDEPLPNWLVVHHAQPWDQRAVEWAAFLGVDFAFDRTCPTGYGGVVQVQGFCAYGMDQRPATMSCWQDCGPWAFDGQYHWRLARPLRFDEPIPGPGRQRLWVPPDEVVDAVNERLYREAM